MRCVIRIFTSSPGASNSSFATQRAAPCTSPRAGTDSRQASAVRASVRQPPNHSRLAARAAGRGTIPATACECDCGERRCQPSVACSGRIGWPPHRLELRTRQAAPAPCARVARRPRNSRLGCGRAGSWETSVAWPRRESSRNAGLWHGRPSMLVSRSPRSSRLGMNISSTLTSLTQAGRPCHGVS